MSRRASLSRRFRQQSTFTEDYAPLYHRLFDCLAGWLEADDDDPLVAWLLATTAQRAAFNVTLLLAAALHRDVLAGRLEAAPLAAYYPTVGGTPPAADDPDFPTHLRRAIWSRRRPLARFIQTRDVQTNETSRGLTWLLPLAGVPWPAVHLVDLGASAGLNLVADRRAYRLVDATGRPLGDVGAGEPVQFLVQCDGVKQLPAGSSDGPAILSRDGVDQAPFSLDDQDAELTLQSFVWGDQPERLARLREGIAALREANEKAGPVHLHAVRLPEQLAGFLERQEQSFRAPILLYNSYITQYLPEKGAGLRPSIAQWAVGHSQPVLWLQAEPLWGGPAPPHPGWCAWTADLWQDGQHRHWQLAWVHPHGLQVQFLPDWSKWLEFCSPG